MGLTLDDYYFVCRKFGERCRRRLGGVLESVYSKHKVADLTPGSGNHILVDTLGNAAVVEKSGFKLIGVGKAQNGWIACGNLFVRDIPHIDFSKNEWVAAALSRYRSLERCGEGPHTFEAAKRVLGSHDGSPSGSVCNNSTSCSVMHLPAEKKVYFTQRYSCQYDFTEYSVKVRGTI